MGIIIGSDEGNAGTGSVIPTIADTYNRELIFDLTLQAFSLYDMGHVDFPQINDYIPVLDFYSAPEETDVVDDSGALVVDDTDVQVTATISISTSRNLDPRRERVKYLTTGGLGSTTSWTLSEFKDYSFKDFVSFDSIGADFFSYVITGYELDGDLMRNKHAPYLLVYCERTEQNYILTGEGIVPDLPSSCIVQVQWDWNNSPARGKWGTKFQAYRLLRPLAEAPSDGDPFDYGERVIVTKNKLRGKGRALSLFIQSDTGKDMKLLGWGMLLNKAGEP